MKAWKWLIAAGGGVVAAGALFGGVILAQTADVTPSTRPAQAGPQQAVDCPEKGGTATDGSTPRGPATTPQRGMNRSDQQPI